MNKLYQLIPSSSLKGKEVTVLQYEDGSISVKDSETNIAFDEIKPQKRIWKKSS